MINWHIIDKDDPSTFPPVLYKRYLVTVEESDDGNTYVDVLDYSGGDLSCDICEIIAWAELPKPCEVPERDPYYNHPDEITARKYMERDPETLKALGIFD